MAALSPLKFLTVAPTAKHTATVIFMHGLGDSGYGWKPVADMFSPDLRHVKWILPHAPSQPVTANMGMEMPSWFDIYSFDFDASEDSKGMFQSMRSIDTLIKAEVDAGIPPSRIVLGGFSQGSALTLITSLLGTKAREDWGGESWNLGGAVILSGWLPLKARFKELAGTNIANIPIFWGHGTQDPIVQYRFGRDSVGYLRAELGVRDASKTGTPIGLNFQTYAGMEHTTCPQELRDLKEFLRRTLPQDE
ncbi:Phospholipase/carboxylesterase [Leucogyrophana mollusca]|uniref:Phospholipase/carboxylesterase n=1 Tax=Leucogyrophana mollusca TaxID=85980 RepID=A0ACB8BMC6_9AGAM|nr:Phospholipase/carboxylesterase [Leucogyrophana mollusca]